MMPDDALDLLAPYDSIFLGRIGDATKSSGSCLPGGAVADQVRKGFDQHVNLRPIRLYEGVPTPVATASPETLDILVVRENTLVVRENTQGEYSGVGGFFKLGAPDALAVQTAVFTYKGCERVIRYAFDRARSRSKLGDGDNVGRVTNCTKSNALSYSMVFWDSVFDKVAADYPDVETEMALVDALTKPFS